MGVDIGGTFTDVVLVDEADGSVRVAKLSTTPDDPARGFLDGIERILTDGRVNPSDVAFLVHGTTVATNTIIQGKGALVGLLATAGFSDVLEIAYQTRPTLYDIFYEKPPPLVPRSMCAGVPERIGHDGSVLVPLDEAAVLQAATRLKENGAAAIVVAFLHSYRNPDHERKAAAAIGAAYPDLPVVLSSDVCPEYREYPRTSTAVVNAVLIPGIEPYLERLDRQLSLLGLEAKLHLMTSSGGILSSTTARRVPVHLVESGPAAGVIGAAFAASAMRDTGLLRRIVALDIGGTTAKAALVHDGVPGLADEFEVGAAAMPTTTAGRGQGYPVKLPVIELVEIGAGGGSIARVDPGGALTVGPESAGADPGPACYSRGGDRPTVTDANLVLGRINPDFFLGGSLSVEVARSREAIERHVARPLGLDLESAARAIVDIANARMVAALRFISIQRGIDPRDHALVPSGGAGPLHAMAIASELGIKTVVVPPRPGLNSAVGLLATDIRHEIVRSVFKPVRSVDPALIAALLADMTSQGMALLAVDRVGPENGRTEIEAETCYIGQNYPLRIPFDPGLDDPLGAIDRDFRDEHRRRYGFASDSEPTQILNLRLTATGVVGRPDLGRLPDATGDVSQASKGRRRVVFDDAVDCQIFDRDRLLPGHVIHGPAVIEQMDTTVLVPSGAVVQVDPSGGLLIDLPG